MPGMLIAQTFCGDGKAIEGGLEGEARKWVPIVYGKRNRSVTGVDSPEKK